MTNEQRAAAMMLAAAIADTIKEAGSDGAIEGHMYAMLMAYMSLEQFQAIMRALVKTGKIRVSNHVCYWVD
jgi:hypothetical protein